MFLIIPILVILSSILAIVAVIWRKRPYLNEMIASGENSPGFNLSPNFSLTEYGAEFFPELADLIRKIKISRYKNMGLMEIEKSLRKTRLIFLKIDRLSDALIKKIRKVHLNGQLKSHLAEEKSKEEGSDRVIAVADNKKESSEEKNISSNFLKNEEQRLIIEIAKNPKDSSLYEMLGDLYIEMENFTDAKESYEASIELNPQNESLRQKLSGALEKLNKN